MKLKKITVSVVLGCAMMAAEASPAVTFVNNTPLTLTFAKQSGIPCADSLGNTAACQTVLLPGQSQNFNGLGFYVAYSANTVATYYGFYVGTDSKTPAAPVFTPPTPLNGPMVAVMQSGNVVLQQAHATASLNGRVITLNITPDVPTFPVST